MFDAVNQLFFIRKFYCLSFFFSFSNEPVAKITSSKCHRVVKTEIFIAKLNLLSIGLRNV